MEETHEPQLAEVILAHHEGQPARLLGALDELDWSFTGRPWVLTLRAEALIALGRRDEANDALEQLVVLYPARAEAWIALGRFAVGDGDFQRAALCGERALALEPDDGAALAMVSGAWLDLGDRARAHQCLDRALTVAGDDPYVLRLASAAALPADPDAAEDWARAALVIDPGDGRSVQALSRALLAQGRGAEAMAVLEPRAEAEGESSAVRRQLRAAVEARMLRHLGWPVLGILVALVVGGHQATPPATSATAWIVVGVLFATIVVTAVVRFVRLGPTGRSSLRRAALDRRPRRSGRWSTPIFWGVVSGIAVLGLIA